MKKNTLNTLCGFFALVATANAQLTYTTGLDVWLDASDIDGSNNSTLSDGDPVATWLNKGTTGVNDAIAILSGGSGGTNGVFVAGGGNGPQDAIQLSNTRYQFGQEFMDSPNVTMYFVVQRTGGGQGALLNDYGDGSELWLLNTNLNPAPGTVRNYLRDVDGDTAINNPAGLALDTWETVYAAMDSTVSTAYFGFIGGTIGSDANVDYDPTIWSATDSGNTARRPTIFGFWDGNNTHDFNGFVSEVLIYDHILTPADQATVEAYLASKSSFPDVDADGLNDLWEDEHFGDGDGTATPAELALQAGGDDGYPVADNDGLDNTGEQANGTDPNDPDSDADDLNDGDEVSGALNPYKVGHNPGDPPAGAPGEATNPLNDDSDNDGILDGEEVVIGSDNFVTNPNDGDTDFDFMDDLYEVTNNLLGGLDPTDFSDGEFGQDLDGDGLDNVDEYDRAPQTRADMADTDGDGYDDLTEDGSGVWNGDLATGTDPTKVDSDGDGLLDSQENPDLAAHNPPSQYKTDPNFFDTDGDLWGDGAEVTADTDPDDINDFPSGNNRDFETGDVSAWKALGWSGGRPMTIDSATPLAGNHSLTSGSDATNRSNTQNTGTFTGFSYSMLFRLDSLGAGGSPRGMDWNLSSSIDGASGADLRFKVDPGGIFGIGLNGGTGWNAPLDDTSGLGFTPIEGTTYRWDITATGFDGTSSASFDLQIFEGATEVFTSTGNTFTAGVADPIESVNFIRGANWGGGGFTVDDIAITALLPANELRITAAGFNGSGDFEVTVTGLDTAKSYVLKRSANLADGFPVTAFGPFTPVLTTETVADTAPPAGKAFYRIEDAP